MVLKCEAKIQGVLNRGEMILALGELGVKPTESQEGITVVLKNARPDIERRVIDLFSRNPVFSAIRHD